MICHSNECEQEATTVLLFEYPERMAGAYCDTCADYLALIGPHEVKETNPLVLGPRHKVAPNIESYP